MEALNSTCNGGKLIHKLVGELAHTLLSFKRSTSPHRTATVQTIHNFHLG